MGSPTGDRKELRIAERLESSFQRELKGIRKRLYDIEESLGNLEIAANEMQDYSYAFNNKILTVPELGPVPFSRNYIHTKISNIKVPMKKIFFCHGLLVYEFLGLNMWVLLNKTFWWFRCY